MGCEEGYEAGCEEGYGMRKDMRSRRAARGVGARAAADAAHAACGRRAGGPTSTLTPRKPRPGKAGMIDDRRGRAHGTVGVNEGLTVRYV